MSCIDTYVCSPPHTQTFAKHTHKHKLSSVLLFAIYHRFLFEKKNAVHIPKVNDVVVLHQHTLHITPFCQDPQQMDMAAATAAATRSDATHTPCHAMNGPLKV